MKLLLLLCTFVCHTALSQKSLVGTIARHCDAMHKYRNFNGNILVAKEGKVIFEKSYGFADFSTKEKLTNSSLFNICSITKEFTAVGITICKERGLLSLDDSLRQYFPDLPYSGVTIRNMLQHTSGIPSTEFLFKEWNSNNYMQMTDVLSLLIQKKPPLLSTPGAEFRYSNIPYMLLALIIERVTGKSYQTFMKEEVFDRIGMASTTVGGAENRKGQTNNYLYDYVSDTSLHKSYFTADSRVDWQKAERLSSLVGNGNIFSTTKDLLKWQMALSKGTLISTETYKSLWSETVVAGTAGMQNYGYGFAVNYIGNDTVIFHNGGTLGYSTTLRHLKNKNIVIISLANTNRENDPSNGIVELFRGGKLLPPAELEEVQLTNKQLKQFTGTFETAGRQFDIELIRDTLWRKTAGVAPLRLIPSSPNRLFYSDESDRELIFDFKKREVIHLLKSDGTVVVLNWIR